MTYRQALSTVARYASRSIVDSVTRGPWLHRVVLFVIAPVCPLFWPFFAFGRWRTTKQTAQLKSRKS